MTIMATPTVRTVHPHLHAFLEQANLDTAERVLDLAMLAHQLRKALVAAVHVIEDPTSEELKVDHYLDMYRSPVRVPHETHQFINRAINRIQPLVDTDAIRQVVTITGQPDADGATYRLCEFTNFAALGALAMARVAELS